MDLADERDEMSKQEKQKGQEAPERKQNSEKRRDGLCEREQGRAEQPARPPASCAAGLVPAIPKRTAAKVRT
jgi:hypothetical protein